MMPFFGEVIVDIYRLLTFTDGLSGDNVESLTTIYLSVVKCQSDDVLKEGPRKTCSNACTRRPLLTNIVL